MPALLEYALVALTVGVMLDLLRRTYARQRSRNTIGRSRKRVQSVFAKAAGRPTPSEETTSASSKSVSYTYGEWEVTALPSLTPPLTRGLPTTSGVSPAGYHGPQSAAPIEAQRGERGTTR